MKLSQKDKEFLERLKQLVDRDVVWIERTYETPLRFVLRGNCGGQVDRRFRLTRQGVRWRFWRLFNDVYVSGCETIIFIEEHLGADDQFLRSNVDLTATYCVTRRTLEIVRAKMSRLGLIKRVSHFNPAFGCRSGWIFSPRFRYALSSLGELLKLATQPTEYAVDRQKDEAAMHYV